MSDTVKFFYLRDQRRTPVACVATQRIGKWLGVAVSTWNPADKFDKKVARSVAELRLTDYANSGSVLVTDGQNVKRDVLHLIADLGSGWVPTRARQAAKFQLGPVGSGVGETADDELHSCVEIFDA